ncbi:MAG: sulfite exporter TauE/SafE family protein [Melioribacteraceae bacterium]|nr:sulfite exporter TauE/SafE family protein [Melioribacteraceae bacterium]
MEIIGILIAILIGVSLGLIGSGGSILTVPALVYLLDVEPVSATGYSLFIVGITALVGSYFYLRKGLINFLTVVVFGIPSLIAVFITRYYIVPMIPSELFAVGSLSVTKQIFIMILFAILMLFAGISMIRKKKENSTEEKLKFNYPLILAEGSIVGVLTGLVGAGGGFLIIPALVLLAKLPMKMAVGTSLLIIAIKSLFGFTGDLSGNTEMDWTLILGFSLFAVLGILLGSYLTKFISNSKLKPAFGWFVMVMSVYIIIKELF